MPWPKGKSKPRKLNIQQQVFAETYAVTGNMTLSYKKAYPNVKSEGAAATSAGRLLKKDEIRAAVDAARSDQKTRTQIDADWVVRQLTDVYEKAMISEDYSAACQALNMIAKKLGVYERHNEQKRQGPQDVERLRQELEAAGWNYGRTNFPVPPSSDN